MTSTERLGLDLLVSVDRDGDRSLRVQLEDQLRDGIRRGALHADTPLPSTRALAAELGDLARGRRRGLRAARRRGLPGGAGGRGDAGGERRPPRARRAARGADRAAGALRLPDRGRRPLGVPAAGVAGRAARDAARCARRRPRLRRPVGCSGAARDARGLPRPRPRRGGRAGRASSSAPASRRRSRCWRARCGAPASRAWRSRTRASRVHRMVFAREGLRVVPVPVDAGGLVVDGLDHADVGAVLDHPSHQYPLGMALAPERRAALVDWAAAREAWILEDDYDGEYRFDRDPVGALQALAPARVTYLGSASKTLAPALRMGWMVVAPDLPGGRRRRQDAGGLRQPAARPARARALHRARRAGPPPAPDARELSPPSRPDDRHAAPTSCPSWRSRASRPGCTSAAGCRPGSRSGRCWRRAWERASASSASSTATSRAILLGYANLPEPSVHRRCARWPRSCAAR